MLSPKRASFLSCRLALLWLTVDCMVWPVAARRVSVTAFVTSSRHGCPPIRRHGCYNCPPIRMRSALPEVSSSNVHPQDDRVPDTTKNPALGDSAKHSPHRHHDPNNNNNNNNHPLVVVIAGPTGVGKSDVAARLCVSSSSSGSRVGHIVSADSVQVYRGVQIGANKPTPQQLRETPHALIDLVESSSSSNNYNAAEWRRDAIYAIRLLLGQEANNSVEEDDDEDETIFSNDQETERRHQLIRQSLLNTDDDASSASAASDAGQSSSRRLPIVVGGTMMYLQWLVHGRPDAIKPSDEAVARAAQEVSTFYKDDDDDDWEAAVAYVSKLGPVYANRVANLPGRDWYRLRRTLEVAYTLQQQQQQQQQEGDDSVASNEQQQQQLRVEQLYTGQREGSLESLGYDVRCFFLCPDDRMKHAELVDRRCEEMVQRGLLTETTNLLLGGQLPEDGQVARAIGYRQTLDYLCRSKNPQIIMDYHVAFDAYLNDFCTATRRYAKKQMQWFRRDDKFAFVPVQLTISSPSSSKVERVTDAAETVWSLCQLSRGDYEAQLVTHDDNDDEASMQPLSARTKLENERQGKGMKVYQSKRYILLPESEAYKAVLKEADECTLRIAQARETNR